MINPKDLLGRIVVRDDLASWIGTLLDEKPPEAGTNELRTVGMTQEEVDVFDALAKVANQMLALSVLHQMEREEICHDIHKLQLRLLARPGLRALGWPVKVDASKLKD